jgi:hypothetical protein
VQYIHCTKRIAVPDIYNISALNNKILGF